jgi:tetratricopeptide (TPR) repeat protein/predicted amidophosphoribosyltransferase
MAEPEGIPCPICGEPLEEESEGCANCGAAVSEKALRNLTRALGIDSAKAQELLRAGVRSPDDLGGRSVGDVLKAKEPAVLYLCPECGAFVSSADRTCGKCGATLTEEAVDLEKFLDAGGTRACPACGETIPAEALVCPACQTTIVAEAAGLEPTTVLCGNCGAMALEGLGVCDTCGEPMHGTPRGPVAPSEKGPVCPSCGAVLTPDAAVCEMCGREIGAPAEATPVAGPEANMRSIEELLEEAEPEADAEKAAAGLDALANEMEAEEAVLDLEGPPKTRMRAAAELRVAIAAGPRPRAVSPVERLRESALVATLAALLTAAYVSTIDSEVGGWAILALAGSLFATALALAFLDFAPIRQRWRDHAISLVGGILILGVPLHNAARAALPDAADGALLILGTALAVAGGAPIRRAPAVYAPWLASLPAFVAAAAARAVRAPPGSPVIAIGTWAAVAGVVGVSVVLAVHRRWVDGRVSRSVLRAQDLAVGRNYKGAIEELDRAIDLAGESGSEAPWYSKGAALVVLGRYEEALACIDTALRMNPRNEVAWVNKGNALVRMGRLVDALKCYNSAIKVNPGYEVGWNNKGNALARLGKYPDALKCYEKALQIDGAYKGAWVNKGYVLTKLGDFEAAARCADEVIRLGGPGGVAA